MTAPYVGSRQYRWFELGGLGFLDRESRFETMLRPRVSRRTNASKHKNISFLERQKSKKKNELEKHWAKTFFFPHEDRRD